MVNNGMKGMGMGWSAEDERGGEHDERRDEMKRMGDGMGKGG